MPIKIENIMYPEKTRSNFWFLLPIFLGLIGGIIAFFILRQDDPKKAKNCLYLGIILGIIGLILNILILTQVPEFEQGFNINV
ncbi:MAG: hypothetical protein OEL77_03485 [Nitrosopumilus sp.]|nr:hypothetical protein [Nitrosopumilus sp.]MDH3385059.1 hypothetical protein [Nitrosopumilus sp.]